MGTPSLKKGKSGWQKTEKKQLGGKLLEKQNSEEEGNNKDKIRNWLGAEKIKSVCELRSYAESRHFVQLFQRDVIFHIPFFI